MPQLPQKSAAGTGPLPDAALDQLFRTARSHGAWLDRPVSSETVREIYELTKWGPTSANSLPARFVFIRTQSGKERLKPHLTRGNVHKTMTAPCCVIIAYDSRFYDELPKLYPPRDMRSVFAGKPALIEDSARRNSTLQGAYLILAARALGLDCGPMSGFSSTSLDADFFPDSRWKSNFLCCLGYGSGEQLGPRNPRLDFTAACLDL
jgi:3-hydroxypropanoate dehydrogenase